MNIYALKGLIKALEKENSPANKYLLQFYKELYEQQLQSIADQVQNRLDQENKDRKSWNEFLAQ